MTALDHVIESRLETLAVPLRIRLPSGTTLGPASAKVELAFADLAPLAAMASGNLGAVGEAIVAGRVSVLGSMRDLMAAVAALIPQQRRRGKPPTWKLALRRINSVRRHNRERDAAQIRSHYDVSDEFYQMWLDPLRVYSCAYFRDPQMTLAEAQVAKLDHICRKLDLREGERFADIGAGWGGLLMHAAENYGVKATGITLSKNQFNHVSRMIDERGLSERVQILLCDYRDLKPEAPFDKLASVGMFEHVGRANLTTYFGCIRDLLRPGGLALNHGITVSGLGHGDVGGGMGDFIEKFIFPGGELVHVSRAISSLSGVGLEMLDVENLRPHYARTLWSWSDRLEACLPEAESILARDRAPENAAEVLRSYRLYLAGCALAFTERWVSLYQILISRPGPGDEIPGLPGSDSAYPFRRDYMYRPGQR
ncbi:class I SAM-dependent methyltransferase [Paracoccus sp. MBLB3053]|uniref:Class I SAM-dependent methyltransferase n=1 Tax=Paracoccus aurantius TaxID=3073814 RepID=A0ABU2HPH9_9RHOB|nr:class I SAM-dependent methyltransferase [Paracoccus sp. MBLB3053]MDS9466951.1 class I SAM-dependent methyltransferase [Paracoccus sp. MBLB3053]